MSQHTPREQRFFERWLGCMILDCRRDVCRSLLRSNDTQCFTTAQYADRYCAIMHAKEPSADVRAMLRGHMTPDLARQHLASISDMVREVRPDVWTATEEEEPA